MSWYIGQEVVAIKDHSDGVFKRGEVFTVKGLRASPCSCHDVDINVGIESELYKHFYTCSRCDLRLADHGHIHWFAERCFAAFDNDISELTEILKYGSTII